jgi:hypothetical protein
VVTVTPRGVGALWKVIHHLVPRINYFALSLSPVFWSVLLVPIAAHPRPRGRSAEHRGGRRLLVPPSTSAGRR